MGGGNSDTDKLKPFIVGPNSCNTETYLVILGNFSDNQLSNIILYTETKFFFGWFNYENHAKCDEKSLFFSAHSRF